MKTALKQETYAGNLSDLKRDLRARGFVKLGDSAAASVSQ